jgi:hypothetical protein
LAICFDLILDLLPFIERAQSGALNSGDVNKQRRCEQTRPCRHLPTDDPADIILIGGIWQFFHGVEISCESADHPATVGVLWASRSPPEVLVFLLSGNNGQWSGSEFRAPSWHSFARLS